MDLYTYTTNQDACTKAGVFQDAETFNWAERTARASAKPSQLLRLGVVDCRLIKSV